MALQAKWMRATVAGAVAVVVSACGAAGTEGGSEAQAEATSMGAAQAEATSTGAAQAQAASPSGALPAPNPYRVADESWGELPAGRTWGSTSAVDVAPDGQSIWVAERCGANSCAGSELDPILLFDAEGELVRSFGAGLLAWPHGIDVDADGNVWVTDATGFGDVPDGLGHAVYKFSPQGELLLTLGTPGEPGDPPDHLTTPNDVIVAPNGDIFVAEGHSNDGPVARISKFSSDGTFIESFGRYGVAEGEFRAPHALAFDSQGRLFVGDRNNNRIQIFDQEGNHLATWTQFSRPSGLYIDENDVLYVADSESNTERHPGWRRGIYIGSARNGQVTAFIPDPEPDPDNSGTSGAEGVAADALGNVYGAEVGPQELTKYVRQGAS